LDEVFALGREVITVLALIYAMWLLGDSRKFLKRPWPFLFIVLRLILSVFLRSTMVLEVPLGDLPSEIIKTLTASLDLLFLITLHRNFPRVPE